MNTLKNLALAAMLVASGLAGCSEQRANNPQEIKAAYVASAIREPFHRPECRWALKISPANLQTFKTWDEAAKAGHRPCKVCRP